MKTKEQQNSKFQGRDIYLIFLYLFGNLLNPLFFVLFF